MQWLTAQILESDYQDLNLEFSNHGTLGNLLTPTCFSFRISKVG